MTATFTPSAPRAQMLRFLCCEEASTAIEYGLLAALTSLAIVPTLGALGGKLAGTFGAVSDALNDGGSPPPMPRRPGGGPPSGNGG